MSMQSRLFSLLVAVLSLFVLGCRQTEPMFRPPMLDDSQLARAQAEAEVDLRRSFGGRLRYHSELRTVAVADSLTVALPSNLTPGAALEKVLLRYPALFGSESSTQLELIGVVTDRDGARHIALRQVQNDIIVWGSVVAGHADAEGNLRRIVAHTVPLMNWPTDAKTPKYSAEQARQEALRILVQELPQVSASTSTPKLYYLAAGRRLSLVYRIELSGQDGELPIRQALCLSALDLSLRCREELVVASDVPMAVMGRGVDVLGALRELSITQRGDSYSLEDLRRGSQRTTLVKPQERIPGRTIVSSKPDEWELAYGVSVFANLSLVWDYFAKTHQRFGWDGEGHGIVAVIHGEQRNPPLPIALFDGQRILLGASAPPEFLPIGAALDVVAHEYGHALIRATASLAAEGESGAIDEGLSNLWACLMEQSITLLRANWTVGESIYRPVQGVAALADLEDPARTQQTRLRSEQMIPSEGSAARSPLSLLERSLRRYNAGFVGHAGFLLAAKIGSEKTAAIVYRALTTYLHRYSDADDLADAMMAAAQDLYGASDASLSAIRAAWESMGVNRFLRS